MKTKTKIALVTGGALGFKEGGPSIGGAIAIRLAEDGFKVVIIDFCEMGHKTVEAITKKGGEAVFVQGDVYLTEDIKRSIQTAKEKFGGLNCLVNCAARYTPGMAKNVVEISEDEWEKTLRVNLGGYFRTAKYAIPLILKSGGGTIINISSVASFIALPDFSIYAVSKAAINGLTRSLATDFAPQIRTNAICPGFVKIANSQNNRSPKELEEWYGRIAKKYPMRRVCEVEEIANVASFLASDQSSYVNGATIVVDGGYLAADSHEF
jgi:NAD(P)-dependent dehydrogenase (short-subunit alcohol dehydrogenase family)